MSRKGCNVLFGVSRACCYFLKCLIPRGNSWGWFHFGSGETHTGRLNQGVSPFPTAQQRSRICWSTTIFGWSIFSKYLLHQQILPLQKLKCSAEVCPFWSQIGEGSWCLSSAHSQAWAVQKLCWNPCSAHFTIDLNLHFPISLESFLAV